ncbi:MAG: class 1 fructose-bisphosphatase [Candidatus Binatia bacterium]
MEEIGESLRGHLLGVGGNRRIKQDLADVVLELAKAATTIASEVNRAGLAGILGRTDQQNVHGETVQKLDIYANDLIVQRLRTSGCVCGMASEEVEEIIAPSTEGEKAQYLVYFDPLDGSSNIDVNVSIGTIFGIYRRKSTSGPATLDDFLQTGRNQVAAGYFLYGSSTMLVFSSGDGVQGFTLDPSTSEFRLSQKNIRTPERGKIYSCNEGNTSVWDEATRDYVDSLKRPDAGPGRPYTLRYVGSLVADFHRNLLKGGVFLYPADANRPGRASKGKLRLMYECNPSAWLQEQAGGLAVDNDRMILDIVPTGIHHRVPLVIGSRDDVEEYVARRRAHKAA